MSTAPLAGRQLVRHTLAGLLVGLYFVVCFSVVGCVPRPVLEVPTAAPQEIRQHHRRAQQARHHRVRQRAYPRPNPAWRQQPRRR